jgi:hypothetical protein
MIRLFAAVFCVGITATTGMSAAERTYVNPRFGTTISFNDAIFTKMQPEPDNGDGASWSAPDGGRLLVWGQNNVLDFTPTTLADDVASSLDQETFRKVGSRWMVVSGFDDGEIVYHRAEFGGRDVIHSMEMRYPANLAGHYDRLASRIADSLIGP